MSAVLRLSHGSRESSRNNEQEEESAGNQKGKRWRPVRDEHPFDGTVVMETFHVIKKKKKKALILPDIWVHVNY